VAIAGELTDSPAALASVLFSLTQAYSMNTLGSLTMWMKLIAAGVDDLAVSKHSEHVALPSSSLFPLTPHQAKSLSDLIASLRDYVEPTSGYLRQLYSEGADILREEAILAEEAEAEESDDNPRPKLERMDSIRSDEDSDSQSSDENDSSSRSTKQRAPVKLPQRTFKPSAPRRRTGMATEVQLSSASLPAGVHNLPVSFPHARLFLGANALHYLSVILDGDESLEVKGVKYWSEQLSSLHQEASKISEDIYSSLEEKRNFFSFILTIVTVGLAPATILTGYW
jgi:hypothetical protein